MADNGCPMLMEDEEQIEGGGRVILLKLQQYLEDFKCPICCGMLKEPRLVKACMHRFCKDCIARAISDRQKCPVCKCHLGSHRETMEDTQMQKLLEALYGDPISFEKQLEQLNSHQTDVSTQTIQMQKQREQALKQQAELLLPETNGGGQKIDNQKIIPELAPKTKSTSAQKEQMQTLKGSLNNIISSGGKQVVETPLNGKRKNNNDNFEILSDLLIGVDKRVRYSQQSQFQEQDSSGPSNQLEVGKNSSIKGLPPFKIPVKYISSNSNKQTNKIQFENGRTNQSEVGKNSSIKSQPPLKLPFKYISSISSKQTDEIQFENGSEIDLVENFSKKLSEKNLLDSNQPGGGKNCSIKRLAPSIIPGKYISLNSNKQTDKIQFEYESETDFVENFSKKLSEKNLLEKEQKQKTPQTRGATKNTDTPVYFFPNIPINSKIIKLTIKNPQKQQNQQQNQQTPRKKTPRQNSKQISSIKQTQKKKKQQNQQTPMEKTPQQNSKQISSISYQMTEEANLNAIHRVKLLLEKQQIQDQINQQEARISIKISPLNSEQQSILNYEYLCCPLEMEIEEIGQFLELKLSQQRSKKSVRLYVKNSKGFMQPILPQTVKQLYQQQKAQLGVDMEIYYELYNKSQLVKIIVH